MSRPHSRAFTRSRIAVCLAVFYNGCVDDPQPPAADPHAEAREGLIYGVSAYLTWGLLIPIYFHALKHVSPPEVLAHRVIWCVVFLAALTSWRRQWPETLAAMKVRRTCLMLIGTSLLIAVNWLVFIYAMSNEKMLEASLGYFTTPLVNVLLGLIFLRETLRPLQVLSLLLAVAGVGVMAYGAGTFPWVAVTLALSFGFYGLLRKMVRAGPLVGLSVETSLLLPPALIYLGWLIAQGKAAHDARTLLLLLPAGVITAVPLLWFTNAARRLKLATIGFLQYIGPTCQFLLAVLWFGEPFQKQRAVAFAIVWSAVLVYCVDSYLVYRAREPRAPAIETG